MTYRVAPYIHYRTIHDEAVLLDTRTDTYLGLNATAAVVWSVLAEGGCPAAAVEEVVTQFDVTPATACADVPKLVEELVARGLLERVDG